MVLIFHITLMESWNHFNNKLSNKNIIDQKQYANFKQKHFFITLIIVGEKQ